MIRPVVGWARFLLSEWLAEAGHAAGHSGVACHLHLVRFFSIPLPVMCSAICTVRAFTYLESSRFSRRLLSRFSAANQKKPPPEGGCSQVSVNARTVHIALHITEAELKKAYEMQMARNAAMPGGMPGFSQPLVSGEARPADTGLIIQTSEQGHAWSPVPPFKKQLTTLNLRCP